MKRKFYLSGVIIILIGIFYFSYNKTLIKQEMGLQRPFIDADLQQEGDNAIIKKAYLDKPGYIVLSLIEYNKPEKTVGVSELFEGEKSNLIINLKNMEKGEYSFAIEMYYDNGDGIFNSSDDLSVNIIQNMLSKASCNPAPISSC